MKQVLITALVLVYDLMLLAGTAYLVQEYAWSMWTFLLACVLMVSVNFKDEK